MFAIKSFECMPWVRTPEASQATRLSRLLRFCLPHWETGSATSTTIDFGATYPIHLRSGLHSPCLRFAVAVTGHHARLGTWLLARLCQGSHFGLLYFMRFQGATPHRSVRALLTHTAPTSSCGAKSLFRIGMNNTCFDKMPVDPGTELGPVQPGTLTAAP